MINRIVSHYRIDELAGEGGAGRVYLARDLSLDKPVALKFLRPELAADPEALDRFLREARLAATLDDGHVCTVHAIERDDEGSWYIAMNWYEGGTLDRRAAAGPIAPEQAVAWVRQTALGLAAAHRHGIVHRDIKPANLILDDRDQVRILDFGVARLQDSERRTRAGTLTGTVAYMAPEQARGEEGTAASDIWSAGVVLYELLAGRRPYQGEYEAALLFEIVHGTPAPLPRDLGPLRAGCQAVVDRCLAKDPADRYASAQELADDLAALLAGQPPARRPRRRRIAAAAVVLAAIAAGALFGPDLRSLVGGGDGPRGVVVLGITFADPDPDHAALGAGYAWYLADRLSGLEHASDAFWVVPPGDAEQLGVDSEIEAESLLGVRRTLGGRGRLQGNVLTLDLVFHDAVSGRHEEMRFSDDLANLPTWQQTVPAWAAGVLDRRFGAGVPDEFTRHCTTVPAAFRAGLEGSGVVWDPAAGKDPGKLARGVALLAAAVAEDSSYATARADWCWARYRQVRDDDAKAAGEAYACLQAAIRADGRAVWPQLYAALAARAAGHGADALACYDRVLAIDPVNHAALTGKAEVLAAAGRADEASALYDRAVHARPGYGPLLLKAARFRYDLADYRQAEHLAARAAAVIPGHYFAHLLLGAARFNQDDFAGATAAFHQSLACRPTGLVYQNLGTIAYYEGRYADAAGYYTRALDFGRSADAWKMLGEAWRWQAGFADSARAAYGRAIALAERDLASAPEDWDLWAELATFHTARRDSAEAAALVARIEAAAPSLSCDGMFYLSVANEDLGRRGPALDWLERAFACGLTQARPERYPGFRNLRADPRYRALVRRHGGTS